MIERFVKRIVDKITMSLKYVYEREGTRVNLRTLYRINKSLAMIEGAFDYRPPVL